MARKKNFDEQEVLDKALQLFWRKGYHATSIQDLVDELGINRASMYDTWGDKHRLYLAALKRYRQYASSWFLEEIRSEKPARQIIENFLKHLVNDMIADADRKGCFVVNSTTELATMDKEVRAMVEENRRTVEQVLAELIKEGQASGQFSSAHSPESLARFVFSVISGIRVVCKTQISNRELQEVIDITLSALD